MSHIYSSGPTSAIRLPAELPLPGCRGITGRDSQIISQALASYAEAQLRTGTEQAEVDGEDAIAILFAHCGNNADYFELLYPNLVVDLSHLT